MQARPDSQYDNEIMKAAALKIQTAYRRHFAQTMFGFKHFTKNQMTNYNVKIKGNDPAINATAYQPNHHNQIALISTSGLRALSVARQLKHPNAPHPKIIIIDNSNIVHRFWGIMIGCAYIAKDFQEFTTEISTRCTYNHFSYIKQLLAEYQQYSELKNAILNTMFLRHSWSTPGLFKQIKNILHHIHINDIYVYPTNMIGYQIHKDATHDYSIMLKNIEDLHPVLTIHSDIDAENHDLQNKWYFPYHVYYCTNQDPQHILKTLASNSAYLSHELPYLLGPSDENTSNVTVALKK